MQGFMILAIIGTEKDSLVCASRVCQGELLCQFNDPSYHKYREINS